ncbi:hypothetical protein [Priestia megaterium]
MSGYDKKYIKGEHKKECFKKEEEKDCCKKDYCEEDYHEHEKEEKGIYTELQVSESVSPSAIGNIPDTPPVTTSPPLLQIARKTICVDDSSDRVLIQGTVEWTPQGSLGTITGPATTILSIPASFKVWRKNLTFSGNNTPQLVFETTDSSSALTVLTTLLGGTTFGIVTTSFHYVDQDPPVGENEYILTMEPAFAPSLITLLLGILFATGAFLPTGISFAGAVSSYVFTLAEVEENE